MSNGGDWRDLPVWKCPQRNICGEQWATRMEGTICPFCHGGPGEATGFTCGEIAAAADRFGFHDKLPVHIPVPVPDLVQLSTLPRDVWEGLPVFHPCSQENTTCNWLHYDVGVILDVRPDPDLPGQLQCRFVTSAGGSPLRYGPTNLWVPRVLAERLL